MTKVVLILTSVSLLATMLGIIGLGTIRMPGDGGITNPVAAFGAMVAFVFYVGLWFPLGYFFGPLHLPETLPFIGPMLFMNAAIWTVSMWMISKLIRKLICQPTAAASPPMGR